jgi:hypothetical protein
VENESIAAAAADEQIVSSAAFDRVVARFVGVYRAPE